MTIPGPKNNRALRALLGHWSIDSILAVRTALPVDVYIDPGGPRFPGLPPLQMQPNAAAFSVPPPPGEIQSADLVSPNWISISADSSASPRPDQPTAGESLWQTIRDSKDPTVFTVFLEDSAALVGIVLAFCGVLLGQVFHNPYFHPIASVMIAVLLAGVAVLLGRESGALLLGERADPDQIKALRELIVSDASVERVGDLLTMHLGPEQVLLAAEIKFRHGMNVEELEGAIDRLEERIRKNNPNNSKNLSRSRFPAAQSAFNASRLISPTLAV
jgi:hypothetical protein